MLFGIYLIIKSMDESVYGRIVSKAEFLDLNWSKDTENTRVTGMLLYLAR
jgi:hypothetical protein